MRRAVTKFGTYSSEIRYRTRLHSEVSVAVQPRSGIVYLLTGGFFGLGWFFDMLYTQRCVPSPCSCIGANTTPVRFFGPGVTSLTVNCSLWQAATFDRGLEASG